MTVVRARPVRLGRVAAGLAVLVVAVFTVIALALRRTTNGVAFGPADQVAMFGIGLAVAAGLLVLARPRLEADERGLRVRNIVGRHEVPWEVVRAVTFADGSPWAVLELADDEQLALQAVQAVDGARTVEVVRALRGLHAEHPTG